MSDAIAQINSTFGATTPQVAYQGQADSLLLDVRTPAEFEEVHAPGAVLHPLTELNTERVKELASGKRACVVICRSGGRARQAAEKLAASGLTGVHVMTGGMQAWESEGLPVNRGQKTISLERQVRIAAGALVFVGSVLGYAVSPTWIALSAFVGAGLVFAGVTDTCGLGMVIARMPWNTRKGGQKPSCCSMS
jgi:rhodanese-related sulfurtransferase